MRTTITTIGIVVLAAAATACGSAEDGSSTAASSSAAPAAVGATGTYTRDLTASDIARTDGFRQEGTNQAAPAPGALTLKVADGQISVTDETGFEVAELSKLGDDASLEIQSYVDPSKASFCGPEAPQNASYTWKLDGDTLTQSAVEYRCADRNSMLTGAWTRSG
jgi:hypothetical protein